MSVNSLLNIIIFFAIALISFINVNARFCDVLMVAAVVRNKDYKRVVDVFFYAVLIDTVIIVLTYILGITPEYMIYRKSYGRLRYSFGFSHPNYLGFAIMAIVFLYVLKKGKTEMIDYVLIGICALFSYIFPNSQGTTFILLLFDFCLIMTHLYYVLTGKVIFSNKRIKSIVLLAMPIFIVVFYYLSFGNFSGFFFDESGTFLARFTQTKNAFREYGISLFGSFEQDYKFVDVMSQYFGINTGKYSALDSLFSFLPLRYGLIPAVYFLIFFIKSLYKYFEAQNAIAIWICIMMLICSSNEGHLFTVTFSFIFILAMSCSDENNKPLIKFDVRSSAF